ncbi:SpaA isopeptide-forming pilin-related protein [Microbacterium sp. NPDC089698]|uniref:SpaA isopeptide-forming pilin-related protein n=1 Tax=Microbacterium sp. NPDC089698 TaxID=3364200 RepID=UPI0037F4A578
MNPENPSGRPQTRSELRRARARRRRQTAAAVFGVLLLVGGLFAILGSPRASAVTPDPTAQPSAAPAPDSSTPQPSPTPTPAPGTPAPTAGPSPSPSVTATAPVASPLAPAAPLALAAAAAPAFGCGSTYVYSVTTTGGIYQTTASTGASTANGAFTVPSGDIVNALALGQAGNYIWALDRTAGTILRYDASTGLTTTYPTNVTGSLLNVIAGAIDPLTGIYYYAWVPDTPTGIWYIYGFNTITNTTIGAMGSISGMGSSANGDIAFDAAGNLYIVSNASDTASGIVSRVNGPLPTTQGNAALTATTITNSLPANAGQYNSVAFGPNGNLVIGSALSSGASSTIKQVDPATGAQLSSAAGPIAWVDMASCIYPNTMVLQKNLPQGRYAAGDQFTLTIGNVTSSANTATTTGSATGIQSSIVGPLLGRSGQTYAISETAASGSLSNYTSTWSCVDQANANVVVASGTGTSGSFAMPNNTAGGAKIVCTITNTAMPSTATVTLSKQITDVNGNNPTAAPGWTLGAATTATTGTVTTSPTGTTAVTGAGGSTAPWTITFGSAASRATVAVSETQQTGYTFKSGTCTVTPATGSPTTYTLTSAASFPLTGIAGGASVACTYVNQPTAGTISWQKVDAASTAHYLAGSEWTLRGPGASGPTITVKDCTATPCTGTNDTDARAGYLTVGGLAWGVYTLTETKAPAGYLLDTTARTVTIGAGALTASLGAIKNTQQTVPAIPLTGGLGADAYLIAGVLLAALALALASLQFWRRHRGQTL